MAKHKISALRRAILLTMARAGMSKGKINKIQRILNQCLEGGISADFKKAAAVGNSLPDHLHQEVMGRYVANLKNEQE